MVSNPIYSKSEDKLKLNSKLRVASVLALILICPDLAISRALAPEGGELETLASFGWPKPSLSGLNQLGCPNIAGAYEPSSEEVVLTRVDSHEVNETRSSGSAARFFAHPRATPGGPDLRIVEAWRPTAPSERNMLVVLQRPAYIEFRMPLPTQADRLIRIGYELNLGDYRCEGGKVHFASKGGGGYSDGAYSYFSNAGYLARLEDGSLFFYEKTRSSSKSFFILSSKKETQTYARFIRAQ